jgi:RimJ/RimL family protein N-acetyltransferase
MTDDRRLMRAHIVALFTHDDRGRMTYVNEPSGQRAPRFFVGRTAHGVEWRVRDDIVDPQLLQELQAAVERSAVPAELALEPEPSSPFEELLSSAAPIERIDAGPAFVFPEQLPPGTRAVLVTGENADVLRPYLAPWIPDITQSPPLFAMMHDGAAVAVCGSVRRTSAAHEAGVETVPEFRGRGFASEVVAAWARAVRELGVIPLYSTSWSNLASRAVARKLGLRLFGSDLHLT